MYIPEFALTNAEKNIVKQYLSKKITLKEFSWPVNVYVVAPYEYEKIVEVVETARLEESLNEDSNNRPNVLKAVTTIFNIMYDVQQIKDKDLRTAAGASVLSAIMGIYAIAPEYGNRLIGMLKSKI